MNCMEYNQPKAGEVNHFYDIGKEFLERGLAYIKPLLQVWLAKVVAFPLRPLVSRWLIVQICFFDSSN